MAFSEVERLGALNIAEEFIWAPIFRNQLPTLPDNFSNILLTSGEFYLYDLISLLYPNILKPSKEHDSITETEKLMQTAALSKSHTIGLISLFNSAQTISDAMVAGAIIQLISRPHTTIDAKFWAVLYLTFQQCNGSFIDSEIAAAVASSILAIITELPLNISKELRFFMNCNIVNLPEVTYYWLMMMHGITSIPNLRDPTTSSDFDRLMNALHKFMYDDYSKNLAFDSFKTLTAENTVIIAKFLAEHGVELGKGVYSVATHEDTRTVAVEMSKMLLKAVYGSVLASKYIIYNTALTTAQIAAFGWRTREVPIKLVNSAVGLLKAFGDIVMKRRVTNPKLGSAAIHTILPEVDKLIKCKDSGNQTDPVPIFTEFSTQTDENVCLLPTPEIIEKEIIKYVDRVVYKDVNSAPRLCPPCPECTSVTAKAKRKPVKRTVKKIPAKKRAKSKTAVKRKSSKKKKMVTKRKSSKVRKKVTKRK